MTNAFLVMKVMPPEGHLTTADPLALKDRPASVMNVVLPVINVTAVAALVKLVSFFSHFQIILSF